MYFLEDIIAERMTKKRKEWLVRWKGFSHEDDTWEPLEHLSGCEQYIARFEEERDRKQAEDDDARGQKRKRRDDDKVHHKNLHQYWVGTDSITLMLSPRTLSERDADSLLEVHVALTSRAS